MKRWICAGLLGMCVMLAAPAAATASTIFINFESFTESSAPTAPGVTFTNAVVLTSGAFGGSLNEFAFPPLSGVNVAFDDGGPMILEFSTPVVSFSGFFTYVTSLTVRAFNGALLVDTTPSASTDNTGPGGTPNELLSVSDAGGITRIEILGSPFGGSFVVDDITLEIADVVAPEPATLWLLGLGAAAVARRRFRSQSVA